MKDIRPVRGKFHIAELIAQGEHEQQDFKFQISDSLKIARSVSAFANNSGGRLLIGVKDNGVIAGVRSEEDIYMVEQAATLYCRPEVEVTFSAFKATDEGAVVIVADIPQVENRPVRACEPDGRWRAYFRVADENILASPLMVRAWQRMRQGSDAPFPSAPVCSAVMETVSRLGCASVEQILKDATLSRMVAEEAVVALVSIGSLKFVHTSGGFLIAPAE